MNIPAWASTVGAMVSGFVTFLVAVQTQRSIRSHLSNEIEVRGKSGPKRKWQEARARAQRLRRQVEVVSAQRITNLAGLLAGAKRMDVREEWRAHLFGEIDQESLASRKLKAALGFVLAAVRFRLQDATDLAWRPVDRLLASRDLSNLAVLLAMLSVTIIFIHEGGLFGLADHLESVAVVWATALGSIHIGRRWRDVEPSERKPRRKRQ